MGRVEKTVFISYRRTNLPWALNIYHNLTAHGYDVFFDYETLPSGDFEQSILGNIRARAHFVVVLTPSALERCISPDDWLRREIETALDEKRNIVPLFLEGFSFSSPSISSQLTGKLELIKNYNGLNIPSDYFSEAMERLRSRHLNVALDTVLHPLSATVEREVKKQQTAASEATQVAEKELSAQEWFEQAHKHWLDKNPDEAIRCTTEAIRLKPDFAEAYNRRGAAKRDKGDLDGGLNDYNEAIRLKPDFAIPYSNRGIARQAKGDLEGALKDHAEAVRLKPDDAVSYNNRGLARQAKGDLDDAIQDYTSSIELKNPELHLPYYNRGLARQNKGDLEGAIKDYTEAIRLKSDYNDAYNNRGIARQNKGDLDGAIKDYTEAIHLKPDYTYAYYNRGVARHNRGDLDGAIKDYTEAIRLKPDYASAYNNRGITRQAKGDLVGAFKDYTEAIRLKSD